MTPQELIEQTMAEHLNMEACFCEFCIGARAMGFGPRRHYPVNPMARILKEQSELRIQTDMTGTRP